MEEKNYREVELGGGGWVDGSQMGGGATNRKVKQRKSWGLGEERAVRE